jgi:hypothetical protein
MAVKEAAPRSRRIGLGTGRADGADHVGYYARLCGWTLARARARCRDPVATAKYLSGDDAFDRSITDFRERYADQNEQDCQEFVKAVRSGRLEAVESV